MVTRDRIRTFLSRKFVHDTLILQIGKVGVTAFTFLSALLVARLMGTAEYGIWALAQSVLSIAITFNLTGLNTSVNTQLPMAVGAKNESEILNLLAVYLKVALVWGGGLTIALLLMAPPLTGLAYNGDTHIGWLAALLSLTVVPDMLYGLITTSLQSQRAMQRLVIVTNLNQLVLLICTLVALLLSPTALSMVISRITYSVSTCLMAVWFYERYRGDYAIPYPPVEKVVRHIGRAAARPYLGFGFLNAVDKNLAGLYTEIPLQLVGIFAGKTAAGYLELGFKALSIPAIFASALFDNIQVVVPQAIGRRDFVRLQRNFLKVLTALGFGAAAFYALFVVVVPIFVPLLFSERWLPAVPVVTALAVYGVVLAVGGIFGPLYRGLSLMRPIIVIKALTLIAVLIPGILILQQATAFKTVWAVVSSHLFIDPQQQMGAVIGAWMVNALMFISAALSAAVSLPTLRRKAREQLTS